MINQAEAISELETTDRCAPLRAVASGHHFQITRWVPQDHMAPRSFTINASSYGEWLRQFADQLLRNGRRVVVAMSTQLYCGRMCRCVCLLEPQDPVVDVVVLDGSAKNYTQSP